MAEVKAILKSAGDTQTGQGKGQSTVSSDKSIKIFDSTFADTYVYEDHKDMYLLTLKEIENPSPQTPVLTAASAASTSIDNEQSDNLVHHDEISSLNSTHSVEEIHQQHHATNGSSSRRTSYIGGKLIFRF